LEEDGITTAIVTGLVGFIRYSFENVGARGLAKLFTIPGSAAARESVISKMLVNGSVQVSKTAAYHLARERYYIPSQAMALAVKFGKRTPDPQGVPNLFMYTVGASRSFATKDGNKISFGTLEVLVNEVTGVVFHAMYRSIK